MNIKKFVLFTMVVVILLSTLNVAASDDVVMYSVDGRQRIVGQNKVSTALLDGWYEYPVCILYAPDGREEIINLIEKDYYLEKGFLEDITDYQILYSECGEQTLVHKNDVSLHVSNGWYEAPVCYVYDKYGNSSLIYESEIDYYRRLGWSTTNPYTQKIAFEYIRDFIKLNGFDKSRENNFYVINDDKTFDNTSYYINYKYRMDNNGTIELLMILQNNNDTYSFYNTGKFIGACAIFKVIISSDNELEYSYRSYYRDVGLVGYGKPEYKIIDCVSPYELYVNYETVYHNQDEIKIQEDTATVGIDFVIRCCQSYLLEHNAKYTLEDLGFVFK